MSAATGAGCSHFWRVFAAGADNTAASLRWSWRVPPASWTQSIFDANFCCYSPTTRRDWWLLFFCDWRRAWIKKGGFSSLRLRKNNRRQGSVPGSIMPNPGLPRSSVKSLPDAIPGLRKRPSTFRRTFLSEVRSRRRQRPAIGGELFFKRRR